MRSWIHRQAKSFHHLSAQNKSSLGKKKSDGWVKGRFVVDLWSAALQEKRRSKLGSLERFVFGIFFFFYVDSLPPRCTPSVCQLKAEQSFQSYNTALRGIFSSQKLISIHRSGTKQSSWAPLNTNWSSQATTLSTHLPVTTEMPWEHKAILLCVLTLCITSLVLGKFLSFLFFSCNSSKHICKDAWVKNKQTIELCKTPFSAQWYCDYLTLHEQQYSIVKQFKCRDNSIH